MRLDLGMVDGSINSVPNNPKSLFSLLTKLFTQVIKVDKDW